MALENEIIQFKSVEPYFTVEKLGYKPNTVREVDLTDERFRKLAMMQQLGKFGKIKIYLPNWESDEFIRQIQHIAFWKNLAIISWVHTHN